MFIQTESTPNPATLKFLPGRAVLATGTADFPTPDAAEASPLARRIFATGDVTGVFFGPDFVTVTKSDAVDWAHIKPGVVGAIIPWNGPLGAFDDSGTSMGSLVPVDGALWLYYLGWNLGVTVPWLATE